MNAIEGVEILLIEDNAYDAEMTIRTLKKDGLANNLVHLKDGAEALDFIYGTEPNGNGKVRIPKVILLDLKMPKIDGIQVLTKLKSDKRTRAIPVVVLTSSKEDPDIFKCYSLGVNSYIVKPVEFSEFFEVVTKLGMYWLLVNQSPS